jgi:quercetin dioxygenase-like cupin family protein
MGEDIKLGDMIDMVGARFEMVARMGIAPGDTVLFRTRMAPGKLVPLHSHIDPECFYVLDGRLDVFLMNDAPKWNVVQAGRSLLIADGIKHAVRNSAETAADLVFATNNRFASFLGEAGRLVAANAPFAAPSSDDIQRMLQASQAYGYWNASPAESAAITG